MTDLNEVVEKVKNVENGVTNLIVPLLKDTIEDSNRHNRRLFIANLVLIITLLIVSISSMVLVTYQTNKYQDFLEQFDTTETIYQETSDNSSITRGINITK
jgi:sulfate adenylyltransferase subunit 1 (EFTu-like GTPase family)